MITESAITQSQANGELSAADSNSILALIFMAMFPIQDALSVIVDKKSSFIGEFFVLNSGIYTRVIMV